MKCLGWGSLVALFVTAPPGNFNGRHGATNDDELISRSAERRRPTQKIDLLCTNLARSLPPPKFQPWKRSSRPRRTKLPLFPSSCSPSLLWPSSNSRSIIKASKLNRSFDALLKRKSLSKRDCLSRVSTVLSSVIIGRFTDRVVPGGSHI